MSDFETKDSGERAALANGMVRDSEAGKVDYTLVLDGPLFERWVALLGRGAVKYQPRNWCKALESTNPEERAKTKERFRRSAIRHMMQWLRGERDEDHAAAVVFNLNGYEAMLETDWRAVPVTPAHTEATIVGVVRFGEPVILSAARPDLVQRAEELASTMLERPAVPVPCCMSSAGVEGGWRCDRCSS